MFFHWNWNFKRNLLGKVVLDTLEVVGVVINGDGDNSLTLGEDDDVNNGDGDKALTLSGRGDGDDDGDGVEGRRALDPILLTLKNEKLVIDLDWCTGVPKFLTILKLWISSCFLRVLCKDSVNSPFVCLIVNPVSLKKNSKWSSITIQKGLKNDDSTFKLFFILTTFQEKLLDWTKGKPRM